MQTFAPRALSSEHTMLVSHVMYAALNAVDPTRAVEAVLKLEDNILWVGDRQYRLDNYAHILLVGVGKAAPAMGRGVVNRLGSRIEKGLLICKHLPAPDDAPFPPQIHCLQGNHPVPAQDSLNSAGQLAQLLAHSDPATLVISLISGGGSALMTLPQAGVSLEDLQQLTRQLLACGAEIGEINTLRKHLDQVKGGGLVQLSAPAQIVSLILSDVVGSPLEVIASGPTSPDPSTYAGALAVLKKYALEDQVPPVVRQFLISGENGLVPETLKPGDPRLEKVYNLVVGDNRTAAAAALSAAQNLGVHGRILTDSLTGEASQAGHFLAETLQKARLEGPPNQAQCLIAGGETTVTLQGSGLGGRNQEVALASGAALAGLPNIALVTLATDGEDGPTNAAGAVVTGESLGRAQRLHLDPFTALAQNDSYPFFESLGDLVKIGPTGTNVNDLNFLWVFQD